MVRLDVVVRRVTEAEGEDGGIHTAVRFRHASQPLDQLPDTGMLVHDLSFVYPGRPRHRVGDIVTISVEETARN